MRITGEDLKKYGVYAEHFEWFLKAFPKGGEVKEVLDACPNTSWLVWAMGSLRSNVTKEILKEREKKAKSVEDKL